MHSSVSEGGWARNTNDVNRKAGMVYVRVMVAGNRGESSDETERHK